MFKVILSSVLFCLSFFCSSLGFLQTTLLSSLTASTIYCAFFSACLQLFLEFLFSDSSVISVGSLRLYLYLDSLKPQLL